MQSSLVWGVDLGDSTRQSCMGGDCRRAEGSDSSGLWSTSVGRDRKT